MSKRIVLILSLLALSLSACSAARLAAPVEEVRQEPGFGASFEVEESMEMEAPAPEPRAAEGDFASDVTASVPAERLVIKNANLSIVVPDPAQTMDAITTMAEEMGGFVVSSNLRQTTLSSGARVPQASVTIRVPAERLEEALERIKSGAGEVRSENVSGEDVTSQYTDLQSRLRNLEAAETQLMSIMEEARRTEDVLQVYNNLVDVREEIEVIKGQMQYFEQAAALSSISVEIIADEADQPIQIGGWRPVGVAKAAIEALVNTLQGLVNAAIWIVIFVLPVLAIIAIPVSLLWRGFRRWRRRRKEKKAALADPQDEQ